MSCASCGVIAVAAGALMTGSRLKLAANAAPIVRRDHVRLLPCMDIPPPFCTWMLHHSLLCEQRQELSSPACRRAGQYITRCRNQVQKGPLPTGSDVAGAKQ